MLKKENILSIMAITSAVMVTTISLVFYFDLDGLSQDDWMLYPNHRDAVEIAKELLESSQQALPSNAMTPFYQVISLDMNQNGHFEHLILMNHPYYCGSGGCTLFIYKANDELIQKITGIHAPISMKHRNFGSYPDLFGWSQSKLRHVRPNSNSLQTIYDESSSKNRYAHWTSFNRLNVFNFWNT